MTKLTEKQEEELKGLKMSANLIVEYLAIFNTQSSDLTNDWLLSAIETSADCIKYAISSFKNATPTEDYHANLNPIFQDALKSFA